MVLKYLLNSRAIIFKVGYKSDAIESTKIHDDAVTSFCCILLTFLDITGKVFCTAHDVDEQPLAVGIGGWEAILFGNLMGFRKILLMLINCAVNVLCSLSMTVHGSCDAAQRGD